MKTKFCCTVLDGKYNYYDLKIAKENFHVKKTDQEIESRGGENTVGIW